MRTGHNADSPLESCTVITADANELARKVHNRMPVLLHENDYAAWLDPANQDGESLRYLFEPFPAGEMTVRPVTTFVNNARNEGPECVEIAFDSANSGIDISLT